MTQNEFHLSFSDGPFQQHQLCIHCDNRADVHLVLLDNLSQSGGNFCLSCSEVVMSNLRKQRLAHAGADRIVERPLELSSIDGAHKPSSLNDHTAEEGEAGIIYWEGHGWSSDGPFAGA